VRIRGSVKGTGKTAVLLERVCVNLVFSAVCRSGWWMGYQQIVTRQSTNVVQNRTLMSRSPFTCVEAVCSTLSTSSHHACSSSSSLYLASFCRWSLESKSTWRQRFFWLWSCSCWWLLKPCRQSQMSFLYSVSNQKDEAMGFSLWDWSKSHDDALIFSQYGNLRHWLGKSFFEIWRWNLCIFGRQIFLFPQHHSMCSTLFMIDQLVSATPAELAILWTCTIAANVYLQIQILTE